MSIISNYRPIPLSSTFAKLFEYAVLVRMRSFLDKHNVLTPKQHGYCINKSAMTAISSFYEKVLRDINNSELPVAVFCDLSKAFDCVPHKRLLDKLEAYGIRGNFLKWFESYLNNRMQFVQISFFKNGSCERYRSRALPVILGVPQGSVLGPFLFLVYLNDIVEFLADYFMVMYADDTSAVVSCKSLQETEIRCNNMLEKLHKWFAFNGLLLNCNKTNAILFHTVQRNLSNTMSLSINNENINFVNSCSFLGVTISDTLQWNDHADKLITKLNVINYKIRCLTHCLEINVLKKIYFAEAQSRLSYGILLWGNSSQFKRIFLCQKRLVRSMVGTSTRKSCKDIFRDLGILTLANLLILELALYAFDNRDRLNNRNSSKYETRYGHLLLPQQTKLTIVQKSLTTMSVRVFNKLPREMKLTNRKIFKRSLKHLLIKHIFYSLEEFFMYNIV